MNDMLTLASQEAGQGETKFQLHTAVKADGMHEEEDGIDMDTQPEMDGSDALSLTSSSVGTARQMGEATATGRMLQASMVTPLIVLSTNACGDFEASVLVDPPSSMAGTAPWSSLQLSSLHSLAQANLISETQQQIAKQLSAQGEEEQEVEPQGKKRKKTGVRGGEKRSPRIKFAYDLRKDLRTDPQVDVQRSQKKQIAIFEPQPSEPKTFVCKYKGCGRQFAWQAHFKYHMLTHTNDRRFMCEEAECGKRFLTLQRLQVHKRTHTGERPFVCQAEDCGKSFTTAGNLKNHSRVHTGERPFACDINGCDRRFAEYSSLHKHSLTHSGAKPFTCDICGKSFSQSGSRRVHMNRHKLDEAKAAAAQEASEADVEDGAAVDDSDFKSDLSVKVDSDSVLCSSHDDNLHYQDLQNAESVVFSQGLTDHIVTVTTQPTDGETETLEMTHDILGAEEVLVDAHMSDPGAGGGSVVVLSQPSHMDSLHHPSLSHPYPLEDHKILTQSVQPGDYDPTQLLHSHLHHEGMSASHHHVLAYPTLDPSSQHSHDAQAVAEEIEVSVSTSSSSHPQSGHSIHMDPMMESDDEYDLMGKDAS